MAPLPLSARRLIVAAALISGAVIAGVAPAALPLPGLVSQQSGCASGEDSDLYTGACVPYLVPNTPAGACPPGVSGAECPGSSSGQAVPPPTPTPFQPSPELQELEDIATPGY
jgi:hypothetical protein